MRNILLFVMMLITTIANAANLLTKQYIGSVYYNIYDDGTAEVTYGVIFDQNTYQGAVVIDEKIYFDGKEYSVTSIGDRAFSGSKLNSIQIPNSVKSIGEEAFFACSNLTTIDIPNSVVSLGYSTFYASSLRSVKLSESLKSIPFQCFWACNLESIVIPNSVEYIGSCAFWGCTFLSSIEIPNSVTYIGNSAFYNCGNLSSIKLSNSLTRIGEETFSECISLTSIEIPNTVTFIGNWAFAYCKGLESVVIPNSVNTIVDQAFERCSKCVVTLCSDKFSATDEVFKDVKDVVLCDELKEEPVDKESSQYYLAKDYIVDNWFRVDEKLSSVVPVDECGAVYHVNVVKNTYGDASFVIKNANGKGGIKNVESLISTSDLLIDNDYEGKGLCEFNLPAGSTLTDFYIDLTKSPARLTKYAPKNINGLKISTPTTSSLNLGSKIVFTSELCLSDVDTDVTYTWKVSNGKSWITPNTPNTDATFEYVVLSDIKEVKCVAKYRDSDGNLQKIESNIISVTPKDPSFDIQVLGEGVSDINAVEKEIPFGCDVVIKMVNLPSLKTSNPKISFKGLEATDSYKPLTDAVLNDDGISWSLSLKESGWMKIEVDIEVPASDGSSKIARLKKESIIRLVYTPGKEDFVQELLFFDDFGYFEEDEYHYVKYKDGIVTNPDAIEKLDLSLPSNIKWMDDKNGFVKGHKFAMEDPRIASIPLNENGNPDRNFENCYNHFIVQPYICWCETGYRVEDGYYAILSNPRMADGGSKLSGDAYDYWDGTDHTGSNDGTKQGAMLMVNCAPDAKDAVIYERNFEITDDYETNKIFFSAFVSNAQALPMPGTPVNIRIDIYEKGSTTVLVSVESGDVVSRNDASNSWSNLTALFSLHKGNYILKIVNNAASGYGNDILLDDISLMITSPVDKSLDNIAEQECYTTSTGDFYDGTDFDPSGNVSTIPGGVQHHFAQNGIIFDKGDIRNYWLGTNVNEFFGQVPFLDQGIAEGTNNYMFCENPDSRIVSLGFPMAKYRNQSYRYKMRLYIQVNQNCVRPIEQAWPRAKFIARTSMGAITQDTLEVMAYDNEGNPLKGRSNQVINGEIQPVVVGGTDIRVLFPEFLDLAALETNDVIRVEISFFGKFPDRLYPSVFTFFPTFEEFECSKVAIDYISVEVENVCLSPQIVCAGEYTTAHAAGFPRNSEYRWYKKEDDIWVEDVANYNKENASIRATNDSVQYQLRVTASNYQKTHDFIVYGEQCPVASIKIDSVIAQDVCPSSYPYIYGGTVEVDGNKDYIVSGVYYKYDKLDWKSDPVRNIDIYVKATKSAESDYILKASINPDDCIHTDAVYDSKGDIISSEFLKFAKDYTLINESDFNQDYNVKFVFSTADGSETYDEIVVKKPENLRPSFKLEADNIYADHFLAYEVKYNENLVSADGYEYEAKYFVDDMYVGDYDPSTEGNLYGYYYYIHDSSDLIKSADVNCYMTVYDNKGCAYMTPNQLLEFKTSPLLFWDIDQPNFTKPTIKGDYPQHGKIELLVCPDGYASVTPYFKEDEVARDYIFEMYRYDEEKSFFVEYYSSRSKLAYINDEYVYVPEIGKLTLAQGYYTLICTDGIHDVAEWDIEVSEYFGKVSFTCDENVCSGKPIACYYEGAYAVSYYYVEDPTSEIEDFFDWSIYGSSMDNPLMLHGLDEHTYNNGYFLLKFYDEVGCTQTRKYVPNILNDAPSCTVRDADGNKLPIGYSYYDNDNSSVLWVDYINRICNESELTITLDHPSSFNIVSIKDDRGNDYTPMDGSRSPNEPYTFKYKAEDNDWMNGLFRQLQIETTTDLCDHSEFVNFELKPSPKAKIWAVSSCPNYFDARIEDDGDKKDDIIKRVDYTFYAITSDTTILEQQTNSQFYTVFSAPSPIDGTIYQVEASLTAANGCQSTVSTEVDLRPQPKFEVQLLDTKFNEITGTVCEGTNYVLRFVNDNPQEQFYVIYDCRGIPLGSSNVDPGSDFTIEIDATWGNLFHVHYGDEHLTGCPYMDTTIMVDVKPCTQFISKDTVLIPVVKDYSFIYDGKKHTLGLVENDIYSVVDGGGTNAGMYYATLSLKDTSKYVWSDGTVDDKKYSFVINRLLVNIPNADETEFTFNGKPQTYQIDKSPYYTVSNNVQTVAGSYHVLVALNDADNYMWNDSSIVDLDYSFVVNKAKVEIPAADTTAFEYDGKEHVYGIEANPLYKISGNVQTLVGRHIVKVSLVDYANYMWSDGASDDLQYEFVIKLKETNILPVAIPSVAVKNFIYDGTAKSLKIASNKNYTISGNEGVDAGRYTAILSLIDPTKTVWSDGSVDDIKINFTIDKAQVSAPAADNTKFIYTGKELTYKLATDSLYTISGNKQTQPGKYVVLVSLKDTKNYEWSDGKIDAKEYNFVIRMEEIQLTPVAIPSVAVKSFVYDGKAKSLKIASNKNYTISGNEGVNAGRYTVTLSLTDPTKTVWSDGSVDDIKINFTIDKAQVSAPAADNTKFIYTGKELTYKLATDSLYTISGNNQTQPGKYVVLVSLKDTKNYEWSDGSVDSKEYNFVIRMEDIQLTPVAIPSVAVKSFIYDGKAKSLKIASNKNYTISGNEGVDAGRYTVTLSLTDPTKTVWSDGSVDDIKINFTIEKAQVSVPAADNTKFIYTGKELTYKLATDSLYTISGNKQTQPGKYVVLVSLKDTKNYEWSDGSVDSKEYNFVIRMEEIQLTPVAIPSVAVKSFIYDGDVKSLMIADSKYYSISGNEVVDAGRYSVTLSLTDPTKTVWSDGSVDDIKINFTIDKAQVSAPVADNTKFIYTGKEMTYKLATDSLYTISGNKQTQPGKYVVLVSLKDSKNYEWSDGSVDSKEYNFVIRMEEIQLTPVAIPSVAVKNYIYDGEVKSLKIADSKYYSISGNEGVNAGRYTVTLSLTDPTKTIWSDGSVDDIKINFTIDKAQVSAPAADNTKFIYTGKELTYKLATDSLYTISGNKQILPGKYVVLVSLKDTKNYEWSDGSVDSKEYNFVIRMEEIKLTPVAIPSVAVKNFIYDGTAKSLKIASSKYYTVTGNKGVDAGRYTVTLSLTDPTKTVWSDGSSDDVKMSFTIDKAQVSAPAADNTKFIYTGKELTYKLATDSLYTISGNKQTQPGKYVVLVSLKDTKNYEWSDGSVDSKEYNFVIRMEEVQLTPVVIPSVAVKNFIYDGDVKSLKIADSKYYSISGNEGVDAGRYTVTLSLTDPTKTVWSDGSSDDVKMSFTIDKAQVEMPTADKSTYTYNGRVQTYKIAENSAYKVTGNKYTYAGYYIVSVDLNDAKNYIWADGTTEIKKYNFVIHKAQVLMPVADKTAYVYDGTQKTYKLVENKQYEITGNKQTLPGQYEVRVALTDISNYEWSNGTTADLFFNFVIRPKAVEKKFIDIPTILDRSFVYDGKVKSLSVEENDNYSVSGNEAVNAGRYAVTLSLKDPNNTVWSDGSVEDIQIPFSIAKAKVEMPAADTTKFVYNDDYQTYKVEKSDLYTVAGNYQMSIGNHDVMISLKDTRNYEWNYGTIDAIVYNFFIAQRDIESTIVKIPVPEITEFTYNSKAHTLDIPESEYYTVVGNTKTFAGKYVATLSLKDNKTMVWENGTTGDVSIPYVIKKTVVNEPAADATVFEYDGMEHVYGIPTSPLYKVSGNVQTMVGRHLVNVSLVDNANYMWSDGISGDLQYEFVIKMKEVNIVPVSIPVVSNSNFIYNGLTQGVEIKESQYYTVSNATAEKAGYYLATIALKDKVNTAWIDGSTADIEIPYSIAKAKVAIPSTNSSRFVYNGDSIACQIESNPNYIVSGNANVAAGNYQAVVSLVDKSNTVWENGISDDILIPYTIEKIKLEKPSSESTVFVYNGYEIEPDIPVGKWYSISGYSAVKAGRYESTISLVDKSNTEWSDGTTDDVVVPYTIEKSQIDIPSEDATTFVFTGDTLNYTIAESEYYTVKGNAQTTVGRHSVIVSLNDVENYSWSDGTTIDLVYSFVISEREVVKTPIAYPVADTAMLVYNGEMQTFNVFADSNCVVSGNVRKDAGKYFARVSLVDANSMIWEDGTSDDILVPFTIAKAQVEIPASDTTVYRFNGEAQTYNIPADSLYVVEGNVQTDEGRYDVYVSLVDINNYEWSNGTTGDIAYRFVIAEPMKTPVDTSGYYSSDLIVRLMADMLIVDNSKKEFVSYQWYKNGELIKGATEQFYNDIDGVDGAYKVQVVNIFGDTLFIAEREFAATVPPFNITLNRNPVNAGEDFIVTITGITDSNAFEKASIVVYNMKGHAVIHKVGIEKENSLCLYNVGEYIVVATSADGQTVSKHVLVK